MSEQASWSFSQIDFFQYLRMWIPTLEKLKQNESFKKLFHRCTPDVLFVINADEIPVQYFVSSFLIIVFQEIARIPAYLIGTPPRLIKTFFFPSQRSFNSIYKMWKWNEIFSLKLTCTIFIPEIFFLNSSFFVKSTLDGYF